MLRFNTVLSKVIHEGKRSHGRAFRGSVKGSVALLILLAMVCYGCGVNNEKTASAVQSSSLSRSASTDASFDPCALFSKDDATHILGTTIDVEPEVAAPLCHYGPKVDTSASKNQATPAPASENEIVVAVGKSDDASAYLNLDRADAQKQSSVENVAGIGDKAFTIAMEGGKSIVAAKGAIIYSITLISPTMDKQHLQDNLLLLAKHALQTVSTGVPTLTIPHPDPCSLVTSQDASSMLANLPTHNFFTLNSAGVASCDYISTQGTAHRVQVISLHRQDIASSLYDSASSSVDASTKKAVSGVGDKAFLTGTDTIWVLKGNVFMHMSVLGASKNDALTFYAKQAVTRF